MKKILNLFSLFFTVISVCATALVCHILFIYPNFNNTSSPRDKNISSFNATLMQSDNNTGIANSYQDSSSLPNIEAPPMPQTEAENNNNISAEYQSALNNAIDYSNVMYMSQAAIYDQLTSEYGEHFPTDAAQYAIDNLTADYNFNALQKAKNYSDTMYMSKTAIYDQLISDYGEKFTPAEAQYAIGNIGADWNFNALQKAKDYQTTMNMSAEEIRNQLTSENGERFSIEEANYAIANIVDTANNTSNSITSSESIQNITKTSQLANEISSGSYGNETNFSTYDNTSQQQTDDTFVLNTSSMKIHYPNCNDVKKIAPQNYSTSNLSLTELINQGYSTCGHCF